MHVSGYAHVPFVYYIHTHVHVHEQWRKEGRRERGREEGGCLGYECIHVCALVCIRYERHVYIYTCMYTFINCTCVCTCVGYEYHVYTYEHCVYTLTRPHNVHMMLIPELDTCTRCNACTCTQCL